MSDILTKAKEKLEDMEQDPASYWEDEAHAEYDQMLDECNTCPQCGRGGANFLKNDDPIAYRCGFSDYMDGERAKEFAEQQDDYKELKDAIEEAESKLSDLEDLL